MIYTRRIIPEEAVEAYAKTGLKVLRNKFFSDDGDYACGLAAYAVSVGAVSKASPECHVSGPLYRLGFELNYKRGFVRGFDGEPIDEANLRYGRYAIGYEDGKAAYEAVKEAGCG